MGGPLFQNIFNFIKKSSASASLFNMQIGQVVGRNYNDFKLQEEGYQQNIVAYRCVNMIAQEVSKVPFQLYQGERLIDDHPLLSLLLNPNPMQSKTEYIIDLISNKLISGNAYLECAYADKSLEINMRPPVYLYSKNPNSIEIIGGANGIPSAYKHSLNGNSLLFPVSIDGKSNILHLKTFNPCDHWKGFSPIQAAATSIDQLNLSNNWNNEVLKNGGNVSGVLKTDGNVSYTKEQKTNIIEQLEKFKGSNSKMLGKHV